MGEVCKLCVLASKLTFFVAFEGKSICFGPDPIHKNYGAKIFIIQRSLF